MEVAGRTQMGGAQLRVCLQLVLAVQTGSAQNSQRPIIFLSSSPSRSLQEDLMAPMIPECPPGYVDQTHGEAYWWKCAKGCSPGTFQWADKGCGCACVLPEVYKEMMHERGRPATATAT